MTTFGELRSRILLLLGNPTGEGLNEGLDIDAIGAAHDAILPWSPKLKTTTITGDGTTKAFALPTDFYDVEAVLLTDTGEIISRAVFSPSVNFGEEITLTNSWVIFPTNYITFAKTLTLGEQATLYYAATWTKPTSATQESDLLEPPGYYEYAMALYSAAYMLQPDSVGVAGIGSYKTRVDSGNPEHNPLEKTITFLLNLFNIEMNRHPRHQKAQT